MVLAIEEALNLAIDSIHLLRSQRTPIGSFTVATLVMAAVLCLSPLTVTVVSAMLAIVGYVLLSFIRNTMDDCMLGTDA